MNSLHLHIGGAGINFGLDLWDTYLEQNHLNLDGTESKDYKFTHLDHAQIFKFFQETDKENKYTPNCLFIDTESYPITAIQKGKFKNLFTKDHFAVSNKSASSLFGIGFHGNEKFAINVVEDYISHLLEKMVKFDGFTIFHALSGGTGSGLTCKILKLLKKEYPRKVINTFTLYPSIKSTFQPHVGIYNSVLSIPSLTECADIVTLLDNDGLLKYCKTMQGTSKVSLCDGNKLVAKLAEMLGNACDLGSLTTQMVPYPRSHFLHPNLSFSEEDVSALLINLLHKSSSLLNFECNNTFRYVASQLCFRGKSISESGIIKAWEKICIQGSIETYAESEEVNPVAQKKPTVLLHKVEKPSYSGNPFRSTLVPSKSSSKKAPKCEGCMISNSFQIPERFSQLNHEFDLMFSKRGFIYSFVGSGTSEEDFMTAREEFAALEKDYEEVGKPVIYIYPEQPITVTISLDFKGRFTHTIPEIRENSFWIVDAYPNGELFYNAQKYKYIFWEGKLNAVGRNMLGCNEEISWCIPKWAYKDFLTRSLITLGLIEEEYSEFIEFWIPKMNKYKFVLVQFLGDEFSQVAKMKIEPKPKTVIRVFMFFKGIKKFKSTTPELLEKKTREGYSIIEWGGAEIGV